MRYEKEVQKRKKVKLIDVETISGGKYKSETKNKKEKNKETIRKKKREATEKEETWVTERRKEGGN